MENTRKLMFGVSVIALAIALGIGCSSKPVQGFYPPASISSDDNLLCYVNLKQGIPYIYVINRDGSIIDVINAPKDLSPVSPEFSPSNEKIMFLGYSKNSKTPQSSIYLIGLDGKNLEQLTSEKENVLSARFSPDGKKIYFLSSDFFGHYSPVASSQPHNVDIYSIDFKGTNRKKLTNMKDYGLSDLCVSHDGKNLFFIDMGEKNELVSVPVEGGAKSVPLISDIWSAAVSPDEKTFVYTTVQNVNGGYKYDLYSRKIGNSQTKQLTFFKTQVDDPRFFYKRPYVLFVQNKNWPDSRSPQYELMEVNLDGSDLKTFKLPE